MSDFTPTSQCPKYLIATDHGRPILPLAELPDAEIDACIRMMIEEGGYYATVPSSQYGRRFAVGMWLRHHGHHNGL